jgi:hypothetical protein
METKNKKIGICERCHEYPRELEKIWLFPFIPNTIYNPDIHGKAESIEVCKKCADEICFQ